MYCVAVDWKPDTTNPDRTTTDELERPWVHRTLASFPASAAYINTHQHHHWTASPADYTQRLRHHVSGADFNLKSCEYRITVVDTCNSCQRAICVHMQSHNLFDKERPFRIIRRGYHWQFRTKSTASSWHMLWSSVTLKRAKAWHFNQTLNVTAFPRCSGWHPRPAWVSCDQFTHS